MIVQWLNPKSETAYLSSYGWLMLMWDVDRVMSAINKTETTHAFLHMHFCILSIGTIIWNENLSLWISCG